MGGGGESKGSKEGGHARCRIKRLGGSRREEKWGIRGNKKRTDLIKSLPRPYKQETLEGQGTIQSPELQATPIS